MSYPLVPTTIDSFEHYMAQINRFPLLSREEEVELVRHYRRTGELESAHRLICANLRFVVKIAQEYRHYGLKLLDLVQEGNVGLMMAVKKFDPDRGLRFITYAVWWIRAHIHNYLIRSWSLVKIGTTQAQRKLFFKLKRTRAALQSLTGHSDTGEIAKQLQVSDEEIEEMSVRLASRDNSLDVELTEGEDYSLLDTLADERPNQEELLGEKEVRDIKSLQVQKALAQLNEREQRIIHDRILGDDPRTLQELADDLGISRERVRQLEKNALEKMKRALADEADFPL